MESFKDFFTYERIVEWVATICSSLLNIFTALSLTMGEFLTIPLKVIDTVVGDDLSAILIKLMSGTIDILFRNLETGNPLSMLEFMYFSLGLYIAYQFITWVLNLIT